VEKAISLHISQLLINHDCVVLPGFGALLANNKPAGIDTHRDYFTPPRRELSFNRMIRDNDGLLANRIARSEQLSYEIANRNVLLFIQKIEYSLAENQPFELPQIGIFSRDLNKNIIFKPIGNDLIYPDAYGLHAFHFSKYKKTGFNPQLSPKLKRNLKKSLVYVPVALLLGIIPLKWDEGTEFVKSSMNLTPSVISKNTTPPVTTATDFNVGNNYFFPDHSFLEETFLQLKISRDKLLSGINDQYFIIAASYPGPKGAQKFSETLITKGFNESKVMLGENSRYRVSYVGFQTLREAEVELIRFKQEINPDAWVHRQELAE
jgi:hypothetical protein